VVVASTQVGPVLVDADVEATTADGTRGDAVLRRGDASGGHVRGDAPEVFAASAADAVVRAGAVALLEVDDVDAALGLDDVAAVPEGTDGHRFGAGAFGPSLVGAGRWVGVVHGRWRNRLCSTGFLPINRGWTLLNPRFGWNHGSAPIEALLIRPREGGGMDLEEGMVKKIVVSVVTVAVFVGLILFIGVTYNDGGLGSTGGIALVATIALFILVMAGVGVFLDD
jgi:hypothetical protein